MEIIVGQTFREKSIDEAGPAMTPQPINRFKVVSVSADRVTTLGEGPDQEPVDRDRATFEKNFELIPEASGA